MTIDAGPDLRAVQDVVDQVARSRATSQGCVLSAMRTRLQRAGVHLDESDLRVLAGIVDRTRRTVCVAAVLGHTPTRAA